MTTTQADLDAARKRVDGWLTPTERRGQPTLQTRRAARLQALKVACAFCGGYGSGVVSEDMRYVPCQECDETGVRCATCRGEDGLLNTDWAHENGSCLFGCGTRIESGYGDWPFCPDCKDHSRNEAVCEDCGATYQYNDSEWERVSK